jgi:hypothetical protein
METNEPLSPPTEIPWAEPMTEFERQFPLTWKEMRTLARLYVIQDTKGLWDKPCDDEELIADAGNHARLYRAMGWPPSGYVFSVYYQTVIAERFNQLREFLNGCGVKDDEVDSLKVTTLQRLMLQPRADHQMEVTPDEYS